LTIQPRPSERREREHAHRADGHVDLPEPPRGVADRRPERLRVGRSRKLGAQQLAAADPQARQDGDRQHDDPHPAEPVRELPPEQHPAPERVDAREHRGPGGGEPRQRAAADHERQRA
jgi:hypothetical protein